MSKHGVSVATVTWTEMVDGRSTFGAGGYRASCSCGWSGEVRGDPPREGGGYVFTCPAPDYRGMAMRDAVDHQHSALADRPTEGGA